MKWLYRCSECGTTYKIEPERYLCDSCAALREKGKPLRGVLECVWDGEYSAGIDDIPLPVSESFLPAIPVGHTPLWEPLRLREEYGFKRLFLKDDSCEPTGSFKDRASWLVAGYALENGIKEIALASTGNAASSMAGIGAASGLKITVFLPKSAPVAKRVQVLQYGAKLIEVDGNYDMAFLKSQEYSRESGVLSRNTAYNPLTIEGKKTASFELVRDLAKARRIEAKRLGHLEELPKQDFVSPDHVFVPVGDGVIIAGLYKGFEDLIKLGRITKIPTIWACQAEGSSAIARALAKGSFGEAVRSSTIADSISVDVPSNGEYTLTKLKTFNGKAVVVTDQEIMDAQKELASVAGLFAEPSSSAAWAGFKKSAKGLNKEDRIVVMITGSGLKDVDGALKSLGKPA